MCEGTWLQRKTPDCGRSGKREGLYQGFWRDGRRQSSLTYFCFVFSRHQHTPPSPQSSSFVDLSLIATQKLLAQCQRAITSGVISLTGDLQPNRLLLESENHVTEIYLLYQNFRLRRQTGRELFLEIITSFIRGTSCVHLSIPEVCSLSIQRLTSPRTASTPFAYKASSPTARQLCCLSHCFRFLNPILISRGIEQLKNQQEKNESMKHVTSKTV